IPWALPPRRAGPSPPPIASLFPTLSPAPNTASEQDPLTLPETQFQAQLVPLPPRVARGTRTSSGSRQARLPILQEGLSPCPCQAQASLLASPLTLPPPKPPLSSRSCASPEPSFSLPSLLLPAKPLPKAPSSTSRA